MLCHRQLIYEKLPVLAVLNLRACFVCLHAGACVGALHGYAALPQRWLQGLENEEMGRDIALELGHKLAQVNVVA